jgi:hypothetical protein
MTSQRGFEKKQICKWTFDETENGDTREEIVARLKNTLLDTVTDRANRTKGRSAFVSLSGGMDSRAVLGVLRKSGASPIAVTVDGPERPYGGNRDPHDLTGKARLAARA